MKRGLYFNLFRKNRTSEIESEIEFYLEMRAKEFEAEGMTPEEARAAARKAFGNLTDIKSELERIGPAPEPNLRRYRMSSILQDVKFGLRTLIRNPGFSALVILTLGLGVGATTAIFSVVNTVLIEPLPYDDADRLVRVAGVFLADDGPRVRGSSFPETRDWEEQSSTLQGLAGWGGASVVLSGTEGAAERVFGETVDHHLFDILGVDPIAGRTFLPEENRTIGTHPVAMIGEGLWERRYDRSEDAIGESLLINDIPHTIVGIVPGSFQGLGGGTEVWIPMMMLETTLNSEGRLSNRGTRWLSAVARLQDGTTLEQAQADLDNVAANLEQSYPGSHENRAAQLLPLREALVGDTGRLALIIFGAVGCLLLIACINVINLLLARALVRDGELNMRLAMGAGRGRIVQQFLTEGAILTFFGTLAGWAIAFAGVQILVSMLPPNLLPAFMVIELDGGALLFATGVMALTAVVVGLIPALYSVRHAKTGGMSAGSRGSSFSPSRTRLQRGLVIAEVAIAVPLLIGAGLMTKSLSEQLAVDTGVDLDQVAAFRVQLPADRYPPEVVPGFIDRLQSELQSIPGVTSASMGSDLPLRQSYSASFIFIEGATEDDDRIRYYRHLVGLDYFATLGIDILEGRAFQRSDLDVPEGEGGSIIIGQALARRFFPDESAIGKRISIVGPNGPFSTVVGVAQDPVFRSLTADLEAGEDDPDVYAPLQLLPSRFLDVAVRTASGDPTAVMPDVRRVIEALDPAIPIYNPNGMQDELRQITAQPRFGSFLLGIFSLTALLLSCIGIYGVMAFTVGLRKREIAIRMAVGATGTSVRRMVVRAGAMLAVIGLAIGLSVALLAGGLLSTFLYGVTARDPVIFGVTAVAAVLAILVASYVPARRATRVQPQSALQSG